MNQQTYHATIILTAMLALTSGCAKQAPPPVDTAMRLERAGAFREQVKQEVQAEPLNGPLTLSAAIARAIRYNMDHRVKLMETAVAQEQHRAAAMAYLPDLAASAGYSSRNNYSGARSYSLLTGEESLEYSTSQEKEHTVAGLRASWNVIDFGLAYYSRKQTESGMAVADEQRRKVMQNIVQDVQEAYWRAYIAQELAGSISKIINDSDKTVSHFQKLGDSSRIDPREGLGQQREVLQIRYNLRGLQEQLSQGKLHLAALLNLPPGTNFMLQPLDRTVPLALSADLSKLEAIALNNRPELRIEDSKLKINQADIRKSILEMMPNLELWAGYNTDSNDFLYNNDWSEAGVLVSWNLFKAANAVGKKGVYEAEEKLAETRHLALSMAVVTQVHLAANRYAVALAKYEDAASLEKVSGKLADVYAKDTLREGAAGYQKIKSDLQATASRMESMLAYAELQNALVRVCNTLGIDPVQGTGESLSPAELAKMIENNLRKANADMR